MTGASTGAPTGTTTDIVELVAVCEQQDAAALGWFAALGQRVRVEPDPRLQRWFATAAHRLAWHAELWAQRRPAIPHDAIHARPRPTPVDLGADPAAVAGEHLAAQRAWIADLLAAIDPDLDPSTVRLLTLIDADLADLQARLPAPAA